jgi:site-specific recombinase XerD
MQEMSFISGAGRQFRQSAKTRTWSIAEERRHEIEARFKAADPINPVGTVTVEAVTRQTIERAVELFISDKRTQGLDAGFLKKYERELGRLAEFMTAQSRFFPHEMTLEDFTEFRAGWKDTYPSSTTRSKVQERLRSFLRYCYAARLIDRIPQLSSIRIEAPPTMPLSDSEYKKLLKAIPNEFEGDKAKRIDALIQLMRHSGLAIQDAVTLERTELKKDRGKELYRIVTSRQKTGTHVSVPIRSEIAKELIEAMKLNGNPRYVFWQTGNGKVKTVLSNWGNDLRRLFRAAGFPEGHPHQLRDTFAVGLLEKGVPLEDVSAGAKLDRMTPREGRDTAE